MKVNCDNSICRFQVNGNCTAENPRLETPAYQDAVESAELICITFEYVDSEEE